MAEISYEPACEADSVDLPVVQLNLENPRPLIDQWGLRERRAPKPLLPAVSHKPSGMYFEVYRVPETHLTAILRSGGDWRWRFCAQNGCVEATSGSYATEAACICAIDMLRNGADSADLLRIESS